MVIFLGYCRRRFNRHSNPVWCVLLYPALLSHAEFLFMSQESVLDVANFDSEFTSETATDSVVLDSQLSETVQDQFRGFTYNPSDGHLSESVS